MVSLVRRQNPVEVGIALGVFILGMMIVTAPLIVLVDKFLPDDAFYYYQTARIFAHTGFSSFDGIHATNGYHPLWFLISVPVYWLFPEAHEPPLRLLMFIQLVMIAIASGLIYRILARQF